MVCVTPYILKQRWQRGTRTTATIYQRPHRISGAALTIYTRTITTFSPSSSLGKYVMVIKYSLSPLISSFEMWLQLLSSLWCLALGLLEVSLIKWPTVNLPIVYTDLKLELIFMYPWYESRESINWMSQWFRQTRSQTIQGLRRTPSPLPLRSASPIRHLVFGPSGQLLCCIQPDERGSR